MKTKRNIIWKEIPNYEGFYKVSNKGEVKSVNRIILYSDNRLIRTKSCLLKPQLNKNGYCQVGLSKNGKVSMAYIHAIVAITFLNHVPCGFQKEINHKNLIKTNNCVENLEIVTHRKNSSFKNLKTSSKFIGVTWHKRDKRWLSSIKINNKSIHLGSFQNERQAAKAYQKKLNELC